MRQNNGKKFDRHYKFAAAHCVDALESRTFLSVSLLKDVYPGSSGSGPSQGIYFAGRYLFTANDGVDGFQLWTSDGTPAGTSMLLNLSPNRIGSGTFSQLTEVGGEAYFAASSSAGKPEIWKTDGTAAGTILIDTLSTGYSIYSFAAAGSNIFFSVSQSIGVQEWVTDGTAAGTVWLGVPGSQYVTPVALGNNILFRSDNPSTNGHELWISDGTVAGTTKLASFGTNSLSSIAVMNGEAYFDGSDSTHGTELWKTDGTVAGTMLVDDLAPGTTSSDPTRFTAVGSTLFFAAIPAGGYQQLWKTDGTAGGTVQLSNISSAAHSGVFITPLVPFGNGVIFQNVGDVYVSDGTTAGTIELATGSLENGNSDAEINASTLVISGHYIYFDQNSSNGYELSRSDGTVAGTEQIADINPAPVGAFPAGSSEPCAFIAGAPGAALFFATDGSHGFEPYLVVPDTTVPANTTLTIAASSLPLAATVTGVLSIAGSTGAWTGRLDITDNAIDIMSGSLATVSNQAGSGSANGSWLGSGIVSGSAANDVKRLTGVGVIQNNQNGAALFTSAHPFDQVVPASSDILVKYTYYGDANLDGKVDGSDYTLIDSGFLTHATGWFNGDFNYDGVINGSDYTLIDNAFNAQGASLAAQIAPAPAASRLVSSTSRCSSFPAQTQFISQSSWGAASNTVASQIFSADADYLIKRSKFSDLLILE